MNLVAHHYIKWSDHQHLCVKLIGSILHGQMKRNLNILMILIIVILVRSRAVLLMVTKILLKKVGRLRKKGKIAAIITIEMKGKEGKGVKQRNIL